MARGLVFLKLGILLLVVVVGMFYVRPENWTPLAPLGGFSLIQGASLVFFAYLGFDVVAITAEEARSPQRDVPVGIIGSLLICTLIYIVVTLVLVGMAPYREITTAAPFAAIFKQVGLNWVAGLVAVGALGGITSVLYILLLAQPRVLFAMGRDGLLPPGRPRCTPVSRRPMSTPWFAAWWWPCWPPSPPSKNWPFFVISAPSSPFSSSAWGSSYCAGPGPSPRPFHIPGGKLVSLSGALALPGPHALHATGFLAAAVYLAGSGVGFVFLLWGQKQ